MTPDTSITNIAIIGCGYVFDHYMTTAGAHSTLQIVGVYDVVGKRAEAVGTFYGLHVYPDLQTLLSDSRVELVVNLTSIDSHYDVTRRLLEAGKHVYSEKPLTTDLRKSRELFDLAHERKLTLACAPSNIFSDTVQTMWKAVRDGAIGRPLLVYAEFDDNPVYLMKPERWRSRTGAPWPYLHEYEAGCTIEHVGYHLVWICAIFGPAESVTAFSSVVVPHKTDQELDPPDAPDFSVATIRFAGGVVARVTCSIAAPLDHRMRIIGDEGELSTDTYRHYQSPVRLERFSSLSLNARKARSVRGQPALGWIFGVGGRRVRLVEHWRSDATRRISSDVKRSPIRRLVERVKLRQVGAQDKLLGVAEVAQAIRHRASPPLPPDFLLHINELTLAIQAAGSDSGAIRLTTSFDPIEPSASTLSGKYDYRKSWRPTLLSSRVGSAIERLHEH